MLSARLRPLLAVVLCLAAAWVAPGCSPRSEVSPATPEEQAAEAAGDAAGEQPVGLSPAGVTTRVNTPAQSTEEQYAQACMAARAWMTERGGNPHDLVEPFLKEAQTEGASGPATFGQTWSALSSAQQAAVIIAVRAAADGGC